MKLANELKAPKLSAAIFLWKQNEDHDHEFDELYSAIIGQCSDFAILAAKTSVRKDYRNWIYHHKSWTFTSELQEKKEDWSGSFGRTSENHIAIIVGRCGEDEGAVHCAPMHF